MSQLTGWLLDLYEDRKEGGAALWLLGEDGQRRLLRLPFPTVLYAAGPEQRLRALWNHLNAREAEVSVKRTERRDLFEARPLPVIEIQVQGAANLPVLFKQLERRFPELDWYDADIPLLQRFAALHDVFPLTRCQVSESGGQVQHIASLESRWELDPQPAPLRLLQIEPDADPFHARPGFLMLQYDRFSWKLPLEPERPLLANLNAIFNRCDPDLVVTRWGDTWLLPHLLQLSQRWGIRLPLNRDPDHGIARKAERTYYTYGTVVHRGQQVLLFGRCHVDCLNAMMFGEYGLEGAFEIARVSGLALQVAARNSPGAGITAMQIITALRRDILVPYRKQQTEDYKSASDLFNVDQGGLVYQPLTGLHQNVAEIDFISMYPSIMRRFNISPETVESRLDSQRIEDLSAFKDGAQPGLLPETLAGLLDKRIAFKRLLADLDPRDCRYRSYKARSSALKWLLVVCFGYTGYKNAKFGKIEAHEAVTSYARESLLRAKETARSLGFNVLHLFVDALWVQKTGASAGDFQPALEQIAACTGLPIALDGIYKWIVFLPSRLDSRVPVPNRYFGVYQNGEIKARGIEARRGDTPEFVARAQMDILRLMAKAPTAGDLPRLLPEISALLQRRLSELCSGKTRVEDLLVRQKLSRALEEYSLPSPPALAARQLEAAGKQVRVGQYVRFLYVSGEEKVMAWDVPRPFDPQTIDIPRYKELLLRAASTVLWPLTFDCQFSTQLPLLSVDPITNLFPPIPSGDLYRPSPYPSQPRSF